MTESFFHQASRLYSDYRDTAADLVRFTVTIHLHEAAITMLDDEAARLRQQKYDRPTSFQPKDVFADIASRRKQTELELGYCVRNIGVFERPVEWALADSRQHYLEHQAEYHSVAVEMARQAGVEIVIGGIVQTVDKTISDGLFGIRERSITDEIMSYRDSPGCMDGPGNAWTPDF